MVKKTQIVLVDDLDGGPADVTVRFAVDGAEYEIDLSEANAAALRDALSPYTDKARRTSRRRSASAARTASAGSKSAEVRRWAQANGVPVSARGRVSADVVAKYDAAH